MAEALSGLHAQQYAHLDFSLNNILVSDQEKAFHGDFGACHKVISWLDYQVTTFDVAAPEMFSKDRFYVLPSLNMWAFGRILAVLFVGLNEDFFLCPKIDINSLSSKQKEEEIFARRNTDC
jgi:serine/threonine protein kinase